MSTEITCSLFMLGAAVRAAGGRVLSSDSVGIGGWVIESRSSCITADAEMERLKDDMQVLATPEQFFGSNSLTLRHESSGWVKDKSQPVQIGDAPLWQQSRRRDMEETGAKPLEYDWTFTTSYTGSLGRAADGTAGAADAGKGGGGGEAGLPAWGPTQEQMDRGLLMSRDPILFFAEIPLYESELEDHGASQLSVKVRVMPKCWYVLLRFWLRVDKVMVRLREARLFCQFDTPERAAVVLREVKHSEGTFDELARGGAPPEGLAYADADAASAALQAVAPVGVKAFRLERLQLLP
ncbi:hypothetical protein N2152v2_002604 [Parachlorella kessleri]